MTSLGYCENLWICVHRLEKERNMKIKKLTLMVAMLAMVLGIGGYALAQVAEEPVAQEPAAEQPTAQEPLAQEPVAQEAAVQEPVAQEPVAPKPVLDEATCEGIFREEQAELAATSVYPTSVSEDARACEDLGFVNLYPVPYFYDTEGFMYTYDPVADRYTSDPDPATDIYYIYDLVKDRFYTYDPASGTYL
jgi:hypothetical protein